MPTPQEDKRNKLLDQKLFHTKMAWTAQRGRRHNLNLAQIYGSMGDPLRSDAHVLAAGEFQEVLTKHRQDLQSIRQKLREEKKSA